MEKFLEDISLAAIPQYIPTMTNEAKDELGAMFCHVVANYTVCLYGKRQITKWLGKNKGCTYLDMITLSDIAYVASLIMNNLEYWPEQYKLKKMSKEEQKTYKEENELKKPKFTDREGQSRALYSCGWSKEGLDFYYDTLDRWKIIGGDKDTWEMLEAYWHKYANETGFDSQWKKKIRGGGAKTPLLPLEEEPRTRFSLPGSEGFDDVFSWKKDPRRVSTDNDLPARSSLASDEESSSQVDEDDGSDQSESSPSPPPKKKTKMSFFAGDSEDDDDY